MDQLYNTLLTTDITLKRHAHSARFHPIVVMLNLPCIDVERLGEREYQVESSSRERSKLNNIRMKKVFIFK